MIPVFLLKIFRTRLAREIGAGAMIVIAATFYIAHTKTVAYEQGVASGKKSGWDDAEKQERAQWDAQWARIKEDADRLEEMQHQQDARAAELAKLRAAIPLALANQLKQINAANVDERANVEKLPTSDLVPRILSTLDALDDLERERTERTSGSPATN